MGSHVRFLISLGLVLCAGSVARADFLELTQLGQQQVAALEQQEAGKYGGRGIIQQHLDPAAGSRFGYVRGTIVVEHSQAGDLNFQGPGANDLNTHPELYFKFRPYNWITRNGSNVNWADYRFEWKWVAAVKHEIDTLDDLCAMVSWRCQAAPNADPVAAMQNGLRWFTQQLDPNNQLGVGGGGQQATNRAHEGTITRALLYGAMSSGERGTRIHDARQLKGPIGQYGAFDQNSQRATYQQGNVKYTPLDPDWWEETPEHAIMKLVETIARCQKANAGTPNQTLYNIPFSDQLQASARLVAQFLTADLANVPVTDATQNPTADRVRAFSFRARAALMGIVEGVTPERIAQRRQLPVSGQRAPGSVMARPNEAPIDAQLRHTAVDDDMPLTDFDMASAALDVLLFANGNNRAGMLAPFPDDQKRLVSSLLRVAAGAQVFNGGVQNLQIQDTIGYKAINTMMMLADQPEAEPFRDELLDQIANPTNEMRANAARTALARAQVRDGFELHKELRALFDIALAAQAAEQTSSFYESPPLSGNFLPHPNVDPRRADACFVIKQLARRSNAGANAVHDKIDQLRRRQTAGTGSPEEKKFLDNFDATH